MNLIDMLSEETSDPLLVNSNLDIPSITSDRGLNISEVVSNEIDNDGLYFLPTIVTRLQRELFELNIRLFSEYLLQEVTSGTQRTSIDSLLENSVENETSITSYEKLNLLFDQLCRINKHPTLIMDHFIPKNLLLSELNERSVSFSGKLHLFNRLVDSLIPDIHRVHHILVIAESVKELELIEGIIIGKRVYYNNMSNEKLYNDHRNIPDFNNFKNEPDSTLCLHLINSSQLYNNFIQPQNMDSNNFSLIFSFDANLDSKSPSIEVLRQNHHETPIIIPVPIYSLEHIMREIPRPTRSISFRKDRSCPEFKWKLKVINTFIVNRFRLYEMNTVDFFLENYGLKLNKLHEWLHDFKTRGYVNPLKPFDDNLILNFSKEKLVKKINSNYTRDEIDYSLNSFDYKSYKGKLAYLINEIAMINQNEIEKKFKSEISGLRVNETERQTHFDQDEDQIAGCYRKLRKLNENATFEERKLARIDLEASNYHKKIHNSNTKLNHFNEIFKEDNVIDKLSEQDTSIKELKEKYESLSSELDNLDKECNTVRVRYQDDSSKAVKLSKKVVALKEKNEALVSKLNGSGNKILPSLFKKDELINYEMELLKLIRQNEFISSFYTEKLEKTVTERYAFVEASNSGPNGRNSNRISRASTPF